MHFLIQFNMDCVYSLGLLLVGPPGVGKTYAVKAVQRLCAQLCKVSQIPLMVPSVENCKRKMYLGVMVAGRFGFSRSAYRLCCPPLTPSVN